jgi:glycosyltransferase involved in cell wall biosynthesis
MTARVAVITRTKNRVLLLKRTLKCVGQQTFQDYVHVIVNDGGEVAAVEACIDAALPDRSRIKVIHHPESRGMGGASNSGVRSSQSDLVVLLDDDDTWEADYLGRMTQAFDARRAPSVGGVVCQTRIVHERVDGDTVATLGDEVFNPELKELLLFQLAVKNRFNPNAFLYQRRCLDSVGYYNTDLPVLDDWDFNLRFMLKYDIEVLPVVLANWHWRSGPGMPQSISVGNKDHELFTNMLRNRWLREDVAAGRMGLGALVGMATAFELARHDLYARTRVLGAFNRLLARLRPW